MPLPESGRSGADGAASGPIGPSRDTGPCPGCPPNERRPSSNQDLRLLPRFTVIISASLLQSAVEMVLSGLNCGRGGDTPLGTLRPARDRGAGPFGRAGAPGIITWPGSTGAASVKTASLERRFSEES